MPASRQHPTHSFCALPSRFPFFSFLLVLLRNGAQFNFEGIVQQAHDEPIRSMVWSHSGQVMLSADEGGVVKYWQSTLNNLKAFKAHKEPIRDLSFSPSDVHFVSASDDQTCSVWDMETSVEVTALKGHGWDVKAAKWHPTKGLIITGGKDQLIKLWDPRAATSGGGRAGVTAPHKDKHCLADLHAHKNTVNRLAWCPSNPHWFLSGSRDNLVKVFDIRTMREFQTNRIHKKEITALTWHPFIERLFASASYDGMIQQWFVGSVETTQRPIKSRRCTQMAKRAEMCMGALLTLFPVCLVLLVFCFVLFFVPVRATVKLRSPARTTVPCTVWSGIRWATCWRRRATTTPRASGRATDPATR